MKTKWIPVFTVAAFVLCAPAMRVNAQTNTARAQATPEALKAFMREKLNYSREILEGLTLENYDMVATNALKLRLMTTQNEWRGVLKNVDFEEKTKLFQKTAVELSDAARSKRTPEMIKAYNNVVASCVDCHSMFRKAEVVMHSREAYTNSVSK